MHPAGATTDALDEAVSLCQHHDAVTGTAKQHVANDYHRRLHRAMKEAQQVVINALQRLIAGESFPAGTTAAAGETAAANNDASRWQGEVLPAGDSAAHLSSPGALHLGAEVEAKEAVEVGSARRLHQAQTASRGVHLEACDWLNVTSCAPTVTLSRSGSSILVAVYNPVAWSRPAAVRVPVNTAGTCLWEVIGESWQHVEHIARLSAVINVQNTFCYFP